MKLLAQVIKEKIRNFEAKKLNGTIDLPLMYSALGYVLVFKGIKMPKEEEKEISETWKKYCFDEMNEAFLSTERPTALEEIDNYIKRVKNKYSHKKKAHEEKLIQIISKYQPIITDFLQPFADTEKAETEEETIGFDIIGVLD